MHCFVFKQDSHRRSSASGYIIDTGSSDVCFVFVFFVCLFFALQRHLFVHPYGHDPENWKVWLRLLYFMPYLERCVWCRNK